MKSYAIQAAVFAAIGLATSAPAANFSERFENDPFVAGRFVQVVSNTESSFVYDSTNQNLIAVLDVDHDVASCLSAPFALVSDSNDISFSFQFRIAALDTTVLPTAFIGLGTTNHIARDAGSGLAVALSTLNGQPIVNAVADQGPAIFGGAAIPIALSTDYLAVGRYTASNRVFTVELFSGPNFVNRLGTSIAQLTNTLGFAANRFGLQNAGATRGDYPSGSITVVVDDFFIPGRPPVNMSITNAIVDEGDIGSTNNALFLVSLSAPSDQNVTADYFTVGISANTGLDYLASAGTVIFPVGVVTQTIVVPVLGDRLSESNETFKVILTNVTVANLVGAEGVGTIRDNDVCELTIDDVTVSEVPSGTNALFTVTLSTSNSRPVTVDFYTTNGTATFGSDYSPVSGTLTFQPGETTRLISVPVLADALDESSETFFVILANPISATCRDCQGQGVILNVNPPPCLFLEDIAFVTEGNVGATSAVITLTLSAPSGRPVVVILATIDGTAVVGADFQDTNGVVTILPGHTRTNFNVAVLGDRLREVAEDFYVYVVEVTNAVACVDVTTVFIDDNDEPPRIEVLNTGIVERDSGTNNAMFNVRLSNPSVETITVEYRTADGTATNGSDYGSVSGTLTFTNGVTNLFIAVPVYGDPNNEPDEAFSLLLNSPVNSDFGVDRAICLITNDDFVCISIGDAEIGEGDGGTRDMTFTITLSSASAQDVVATVITIGNTATPGNDFNQISNTVNFPIGTVSTNITVTVLGDITDELDQDFFIVVTNIANARVCRGTGRGLIRDDDPPDILIQDVRMFEGSSNFTAFVFRVALTTPATNEVTVSFATTNGTAIVGSDFLPTNGVLRFPAGETTANVTVYVIGDLLFEFNEFFYLNFNAPVNARLPFGQAIGEILNEDDAPFVNLNNVTLIEGHCTNVQISLSATSARPVNITYCITNVPTNFFLVCASNCVVIEPTNVPAACKSFCCTISIPPGVLITNVQLCASGDGVGGLGGDFNGSLEGGGDGSWLRGSNTTGRIRYTDTNQPTIITTNAIIAEGNSGLTDLCFTLRLNWRYFTNVEADFLTIAGSAEAGLDFVASTGRVVFPPGAITQAVCIPIVGDTKFETNEVFFVLLTNVLNGVITNALMQGTITNDDLPPRLTIEDTSAPEGDFGTNVADFLIRVLDPTCVAIDVAFATLDVTATNQSDYIPTNGLITFAVGVTNLHIYVPIIGDTFDEPHETFLVRLTNALNATLIRTNGVGTIIDNDPPELRVTATPVFEGNIGTTGLVFTITLSTTNPVPVTVEYFTKDGGASSNLDYVPINGVITIPPGSNSQTVVVIVIGDTLTETNEAVLLCLTNVVNGTLRESQGIGLVLEDDLPCISITDTNVLEGGLMVFTVSLDRSSTLTVSANFTNADGSAKTSDGDYIGQSGTLIFPPGAIVTNIAIQLNNDGYVETNETFIIQLFGTNNALLCKSAGIGTIVDTTSRPILTITNAAVVEGDSGTTNLVFNAVLSLPNTNQIVRVDYVTLDDTALAGNDFVPTTQTLAFLPGITTTNFTIPIIGDCVFEPNESFFLRLTNVQFAFLSTNLVVGTILDNDPRPSVVITNVAVKELDLGTTNAVFNLWLSCQSSFTACVDYVTVNGSATNGSDYIFTNGTVCFPPGVTNAQIVVPVLGDYEAESDETFFVQLSNPQAALIATNRGVGTILDDDGIIVRFSPTNTSANEGSSMRFTIVLSKPPSSPRTVSFRTVDSTALGGSDYVPTNVLVHFAAGVTNQFVDVIALSDGSDEPDERLFGMLFNPTNVVVEPPMAVGTIFDGDPPCISINDIVVNDYTTNQLVAVFTVSLSSTGRGPISMTFKTADGTAVAGTDYEPTPPAGELLVIPTGETNGFISVKILANTVDETNEFFFVLLSNATNASICKPKGICTIGILSNQCPVVTWSNQPSSICIAAQASHRLDANAYDSDGFVLSVDFLTNGVLLAHVENVPWTYDWNNVPAGDYILTAVATDNVFCSSNSPPLLLSARPPARLSIADSSAFESQTGTNMFFAVRLVSPSCSTVTVDVVTANGTAEAPADYRALATNLVFNPGDTQRLAVVSIVGDTVIEPDETFLVMLTNAMNASITTNLAIGRILNDDSNCPVRIVAALADQTRCVCEVVTFSTSISSAVPYTIVWKANGRVIPGATSTNLTLYSLKPSDAGEYTVEVNTSCTNIVQKAMLFLNEDSGTNPAHYTNSSTITIGDGNSFPYPSSIGVSCVPGVLNEVTVTLHGLSHEYLGDVEVILVSPSRQAIVLMSDTGNFLNVVDLTFTFMDGVAPMPQSGSTTSGTYAPTNYNPQGQASEPLPPGTTLVTNLAGFAGRNPNGTWNLYVSDDASRDFGKIQDGWSLTMAWDDSAPRLGALRMTNNTLTFNLVSQANRTHVMEGSADLENWFPLTTNVMAGTNMSLTIPRLPGHNYAFYRVVRCPCISPGCFSCVAQLSAPALLPDGRFRMMLNSEPGKTHIIESSSDLINWTPVSTNTLNAATMPLVMPRAANVTRRFYRAVRCP